MTYAEAIRFLYDLSLFGAQFGLENTRKLAALSSDPLQPLLSPRPDFVKPLAGKCSSSNRRPLYYALYNIDTSSLVVEQSASKRRRLDIGRVSTDSLAPAAIQLNSF